MRRRSERVARACHEIRGPLTAAGLAAQAAARRGAVLPPAVLEHELWRAARAVEDLGAAGSRSGAGAAAHDRVERVDAGALLERQTAVWTRVAEARGRRVHPPSLIQECGGGATAIVAGDPVRMAQATANLIANALDHGAGDVHLVLRTSPGRVRIEVSDCGPGLPASLAALIARPRAGLGRRGRGLAIAAEIAGRMGGELVAAPSARGARLALDLPVLTAPAAATAAS